MNLDNEGIIQLLLTALKEAEQEKQQVLWSHVAKLDEGSPLDFYHATEADYKGKRFFWRNLERTLSFTGVDTVAVFQKKESTSCRYQEVANFWRALTNRFKITGETQQQGTGPICFGGFSFHEEASTGEQWQDFGSVLFYVPKFLVTANETGVFLTSTYLLLPETSEADLAAFLEERTSLATGGSIQTPALPTLLQSEDVEATWWTEEVANAIGVIRHSCGDDVPRNEKLKKVVLARCKQLTFEQAIPSSAIVNALGNEENSYVFSLESGVSSFLGATPESIIRKRAEKVDTDCLAGTAIRGKNAVEDKKLGEELSLDKKNNQEHQFVVDFICGKLMDLCAEIHFPSDPQILKNRFVQHLHTPIEGEVLPEMSIFDFVRELHPTPALGGTPTQNALKMIKKIEKADRGFYAAPIGWFNQDGDGEFAAGIRSGLVQENRVTLYAGCGVVADSDSKKEFQETTVKFRPMMTALGLES